MIGKQHGEWVECAWEDATWVLFERRQRNPWKTYGVAIPVCKKSCNSRCTDLDNKARGE